ncbi:bacteriochlorophyll 4-vinyl reductase, partial [Enterococcus faecium]
TQALKKIPQKALTQTLYYPVIKRVLGIFGTKLTKNTFAKGISKAVPVVGGVVSGGINYLSMKPMATKLQTELGKNVMYTEESLQQDLDILEGEFEEVSSDIVSSDTVLSQLERLSHLLETNMITEEE